MKAKKKAAAKKGADSLLKRLMELPESQRRLAFIQFALHSPEEKRDELLDVCGKAIIELASTMARKVQDLAMDLEITADMMQDLNHKPGGAGEAVKRLEESCDHGLAILARDSPGLHRAARSDNRDLTCTACGAKHQTAGFLGALRRDLELADNEDERGETLWYFASHVHNLAEALSGLIDLYPKAAEGIGGDFPNWPFLMFKRDNLPADYQRQADLIGLGDTCAVNPSPRRNWTPLQNYLFKIFLEWQDAKRFLEIEPVKGDDRTPAERVKVCLARYPERPEEMITVAEAELFLESFKLPPLKKKDRPSGRLWAESFLVPLIDIREPDLEAVSAFKTWRENAKQEDREGWLAAIKEGVIRSLETMARED
jgi:hypothetical protein